jgi:hypothetical protein
VKKEPGSRKQLQRNDDDPKKWLAARVHLVPERQLQLARTFRLFAINKNVSCYLTSQTNSFKLDRSYRYQPRLEQIGRHLMEGRDTWLELSPVHLLDQP